MEPDLFPDSADSQENHAADRPRRGRGAPGNPKPRFAAWSRRPVDDGWQTSDSEELPPLDTELFVDTTRTVISRNDSPDLPFEQSINPYREVPPY